MDREHSVIRFSVSSEVEVIFVLVLKIVEVDVLDTTSALNGCDGVSISMWEGLHMTGLVFEWRRDCHDRVDLTRVQSLLEVAHHDLMVGSSAYQEVG